MRFIHTADWHLGRLFHTVHLTDDQAKLLDQFVDLVADVRPTAVLIAGDVYDRGVPPTDAVALLNDVLERIVRGLGVPVVLIAGNHDSPQRLEFGSQLLAAEGLHIAGTLPPSGVLTVPFVDDAGPLVVQAVPYADPIEVRAALDEDTQTHEQAMTALVRRAQGAAPPGARRVLVGHAFVSGGEVSDSERPLTVGGAGSVPAAVFDGFDYVALGHLHRPQGAGNGHVRYAGSLYTYSFNEVDQQKSVSIVEIGAPGSGVLQPAGVLFAADGAEAAGEADGAFAPSASPAAARATVEQVVLAPRRAVRVIEGTLAELLERAAADEARDDYVCARLLDRGAILNAMAQLREAWPNCLHLELPRLQPDGDGRPVRRADLTKGTEAEHFAAFFNEVTAGPLAADERAALESVLARLLRGEREQ